MPAHGRRGASGTRVSRERTLRPFGRPSEAASPGAVQCGASAGMGSRGLAASRARRRERAATAGSSAWLMSPVTAMPAAPAAAAAATIQRTREQDSCKLQRRATLCMRFP
jgi:hypothetical protein